MKLKQHELIALCLRIQSEKPQIEKDLELGVTLATIAETYKAPMGALKNAFTACGISWEKKRIPSVPPETPTMQHIKIPTLAECEQLEEDGPVNGLSTFIVDYIPLNDQQNFHRRLQAAFDHVYETRFEALENSHAELLVALEDIRERPAGRHDVEGGAGMNTDSKIRELQDEAPARQGHRRCDSVVSRGEGYRAPSTPGRGWHQRWNPLAA